MKFSSIVALIIPVSLVLVPGPRANADWVWSPERGEFVSTDEGGQDDSQDAFDQALDYFQEKKLDPAAEGFELILKKYPKSIVAPEAQYRLGTIHEEKGDLVKAHKAYQNLLKTYPQSERFEEVVEREYEIGSAFLSGEKGVLLGLKIRPSVPMAIDIFKGIVEAAPFSAFGDKAQFQLGNAYMKSGQYDPAMEAFQEVIDQYPQSPLVQDARLQMAEASYAKSQVEIRDQSALDDVSQQVERYLQKYGSSAEADRATQIRREVDERNAEKNYRIGAYYEKENYLESALIYYRDTVKRYPDTAWGQKAADKMKSLEQPVTYLTAKSDEIKTEIARLEGELAAIGKSDPQKQKDLEREIKALKKKLDAVDGSKSDALLRRKQDLKRRERELKEKFKAFELKKKRYQNNTSPDFQRAMDRWLASLEAERDLILEEKARLADWRAELGVSSEPFYQNLLSFMQPQSPVEKVRETGEKDLYKISKAKKDLFLEKEKLYKRYGELQADLAPQLTETGVEIKRLRGSERQRISEKPSDQLSDRERSIEALDEKLDGKLAEYEKIFGKLAEQELEAVLARQAGVQTGGPVHFDVGGDVQKKSMDELLALKMHLTEKVRAQQNVVDTLSHAFNRELALQEQREILKSLDARDDADLKKLRKQIKSVEKDIRQRYQDIQDRHEKKKQLLNELDQVLNGDRHTTLRKTKNAVTGVAYLARSFVFGLPNRDEQLNRQAKRSSQQKVKELQQAVELESLVIEAQSIELARLEKQHEILTAKASLAGGYKFRSSLVKVPYEYIDEAVHNARRILPSRERRDTLLNRLDSQSRELEAAKKQIERVDSEIRSRSSTVAATAAEPDQASVEDREKMLREEIQRLFEQLEVQYSIYAEEQGILSADYRDKLEKEMDAPGAEKERVKRYKEFRGIENSLVKLIGEELKIESEEKEVLQKRIQEADKILPGVTSKAMTQEILDEKKRAEQRISDLDTRHDFLMKEQQRYQKKDL
ncbi:MAG: tetratricopeptide repeat protein [Candidatus Omnitrophota bacterium]|jgi:outer membrane protein assembly factor BamD